MHNTATHMYMYIFKWLLLLLRVCIISVGRKQTKKKKNANKISISIHSTNNKIIRSDEHFSASNIYLFALCLSCVSICVANNTRSETIFRPVLEWVTTNAHHTQLTSIYQCKRKFSLFLHRLKKKKIEFFFFIPFECANNRKVSGSHCFLEFCFGK